MEAEDDGHLGEVGLELSPEGLVGLQWAEGRAWLPVGEEMEGGLGQC